MDEKQRNEKLRYTKQLFVDAIRRTKKPERIPMVCNDSLWKIYDAGEKYSVALTDYEILRNVCTGYHDIYNYDAYFNYGERNKVRFVNALGEGMYVIDDENYSMNIKDDMPMLADEYRILSEKGYPKFIFENLVARLYKYKTNAEARTHLADAFREYAEFSKYVNNINNYFIEHYGVPKTQLTWFKVAFEDLIWGLRGIKNTAMDLRRRPEEVSEALEVMNDYYWPSFEASASVSEDKDDLIFAHATCPMAYTILSAKQYEKFYWPHYKRYFDFTAEHDQIAYIFAEGSFMNKVDFFREVAPNHIGVYVESDDPLEIKKMLPNMTVMGGFSSHLMATSTKCECIDAVKKFIDDVAYDGAYIYGINKMISFPNDMNGDNLKAVNDFVREYGACNK